MLKEQAIEIAFELIRGGEFGASWAHADTEDFEVVSSEWVDSELRWTVQIRRKSENDESQLTSVHLDKIGRLIGAT